MTVKPSTSFYYGVEWDLFLVATYMAKTGGKIFYCNSRPMQWKASTSSIVGNWRLTAGSYGLGYFPNSAGRIRSKISSIVNPSGLAVLSETCQYVQMAPGSSWLKPGTHALAISNLDPAREFYHVLRNNTSFMDGHIDSFSKLEFMSKDKHFYERSIETGSLRP